MGIRDREGLLRLEHREVAPLVRSQEYASILLSIMVHSPPKTQNYFINQSSHKLQEYQSFFFEYGVPKIPKRSNDSLHLPTSSENPKFTHHNLIRQLEIHSSRPHPKSRNSFITTSSENPKFIHHDLIRQLEIHSS